MFHVEHKGSGTAQNFHKLLIRLGRNLHITVCIHNH